MVSPELAFALVFLFSGPFFSLLVLMFEGFEVVMSFLFFFVLIFVGFEVVMSYFIFGLVDVGGFGFGYVFSLCLRIA
ncbi:hypothetical protein DsansV1_C06g0067381 [Dioscorea sansibarensis]